MAVTPCRDRAIEDFLASAGWARAERRLLAADASFRRYDRLYRGGECVVLMDAPPPEEKVGAFIHVARLLRDTGLSAPRVLAADEERGLLLLEDFGDTTFTRALADGADEAALYSLAVDTLLTLHRNCPPGVCATLPAYDACELLREALLLVDWYLPAVAGNRDERARADYVAAWQEVLPVVQGCPSSLVLRDFHVDNLMVLSDRHGVAACGLLDFQDALHGPAAYDLVSLLRDARRDVPPALEAAMLDRYLSARPGLDREGFQNSYLVLGAQRNAKILGIFTRLARRDRKPGYLRHIKRVWRLLEEELRTPMLAPVAAWFDRHVPPDLRRVPEHREQPA